MDSTQQGFLRGITIPKLSAAQRKEYPFNVPAVATAENILFHQNVTFLTGENGSGKSTLIEAIAIAAGFNAEGGTKNFNFATRHSESSLHESLQLIRNPRYEKTGFFLRAESFYNVASAIDALDEGGGGRKIIDYYGGTSLHNQSHGESFMALVEHRFGPNGLYILDEPESALSAGRQMKLLGMIHQRVQTGCQFIIATHSPILLAYPQSGLYELNASGVRNITYEDSAPYTVTRSFLNHHEHFTKKLFEE